MDGQYYQLIVKDIDTSIVIKHGDNILVNINNGDEISNSISYYQSKNGYIIYLPYHENYIVNLGDNSEIYLSYFNSEYQEYIDIPKSLDDNNSFTI